MVSISILQDDLDTASSSLTKMMDGADWNLIVFYYKLYNYVLAKGGRQSGNPISPEVTLHSPCKLNILVDRTSDHHGDDGIVPGADEHECETQAHPQEGQGPVTERDEGVR